MDGHWGSHNVPMTKVNHNDIGEEVLLWAHWHRRASTYRQLVTSVTENYTEG